MATRGVPTLSCLALALLVGCGRAGQSPVGTFVLSNAEATARLRSFADSASAPSVAAGVRGDLPGYGKDALRDSSLTLDENQDATYRLSTGETRRGTWEGGGSSIRIRLEGDDAPLRARLGGGVLWMRLADLDLEMPFRRGSPEVPGAARVAGTYRCLNERAAEAIAEAMAAPTFPAGSPERSLARSLLEGYRGDPTGSRTLRLTREGDAWLDVNGTKELAGGWKMDERGRITIAFTSWPATWFATVGGDVLEVRDTSLPVRTPFDRAKD